MAESEFCQRGGERLESCLWPLWQRKWLQGEALERQLGSAGYKHQSNLRLTKGLPSSEYDPLILSVDGRLANKIYIAIK